MSTQLMFHEGPSDRQVFAQGQPDVAYRMFLGQGHHDYLPDVSTLRGFRSRLGVEGHQAVFPALLGAVSMENFTMAILSMC